MFQIKTPIMKTKIIILSLLTAFLGSQMQAQSGTRVNAVNNDISDNLDLRAVADIFGDSKDLADFERRLNDPEFQISNLDLNDDNEVDYLRVIETVEGNVHVVIIQSVLDRDVYQDVATIDIERNQSNKVQVQIVGNEYMYGPNYIYEPVYYTAPVIYASFWSVNYRPYVSNWYWNYYPRYYTAWNPYPVFRYRNNININLNFNNSYRYVSTRSSSRAVVVYNSRRSNGYERQHPNYSFSRRNATVTNRYELDQRRGTRSTSNYSRNNSDSRREIASRNTGRDYSQNRGTASRSNSAQTSTEQRNTNRRDYSTNRSNTTRENTTRSSSTQRDNSQNRRTATTEGRSPSTERSASPQRDYSQNRSATNRQSSPQPSQQRTVPQVQRSQERSASPRASNPTQRTENQSSRSQGRGETNNARSSNRNT